MTNNQQQLARLAITPGDPAGIGASVLLRALASSPPLEDLEIHLLGDPEIWLFWASRCNLELNPAWRLEDNLRRPRTWEPGQPSERSALEALYALQSFAQQHQQRQWAGLVTGPISKLWLHSVGFRFPGHTEFCADLSHSEDFAMFFLGAELNVILATIHLSLSEMVGTISPEAVVRVVRLLSREGHRYGLGNPPRLLLCGLNPHAGEGGDMGSEELVWLNDTAAQLRNEGNNLVGPVPPDTAFARYRQARAGAEIPFDAVVALYHDQGLIPFKMLHFEDGVNITLGLPFVRTSPDHGTAFGLAAGDPFAASAASAVAALAVVVAALRRR